MGQQEEKKTEGVTEFGRRTREEIVKWNQMTALHKTHQRRRTDRK